VVFLEGLPRLFSAAPASSKSAGVAPPLDGADPITLAWLREVMESDEAWRREGLTIGAVAKAVGIPEYRLRRLINDHLGHRNFADFLNAYRISSAKVRLSAPEFARTAVASPFFSLGETSVRLQEGVWPSSAHEPLLRQSGRGSSPARNALP